MHKGTLPLALAFVLAFGSACTEVATDSGESDHENPAASREERGGFARLMMACAFNNVEAVETILASGVPLELNRLDRDWNNTPLTRAASHGYTSIVLLLLRHGAKPNVAGALGELPLVAAAEQGNPETVRALLRHGALVDGRSGQFGVTALMRGARRGHVDVVGVLLASGARVNEVSAGGVTALLMAREHGHKEVERLLLAAGADGSGAR